MFLMMAHPAFALAVLLLFENALLAQNNDPMKQMGMNIYLPTFAAQFSIGFNYDFLKSPLDVSFDNSSGFFGFNVPIEQTVNLRSGFMDPAVSDMFSDTTLIKNGSDFKPQAAARQNPNFTIRVEVPLLGGVASFSNIQNFYLNYQTVLGNPNFFMNPDTQGINLLLRGTVNVPINFTMSWETMSFSYAYRYKLLTMALALHRHVFSVDLRGKVDADLLGKYNVGVSQGGCSGISVSGDLDYPSSKIHGDIAGYYDAAVWSPTLALEFWRFSLVSRFGIHTRAKGQLSATYSLPFFIDPQTFKPKYDLYNPQSFSDPNLIIGLETNAVDSLTYTTARNGGGVARQSDLEWRMPTALTMNVDVVRDHFSLSYTKLFGEVGLKLDRIAKVTSAIEGDTTLPAKADSVVLDVGLSVDHIMLMHIALYRAYINLGAFAMDFRSGDRSHILGDAMSPDMRLGRAALLPIVNLGTLLGTRWQVLLELDVLPVPALRSGVFYSW
jgi:hypothetical protein